MSDEHEYHCKNCGKRLVPILLWSCPVEMTYANAAAGTQGVFNFTAQTVCMHVPDWEGTGRVVGFLAPGLLPEGKPSPFVDSDVDMEHDL